MKNVVRFRFICLVLIVFATFVSNGCRDLFHSPPDEGVLRLVNSSTELSFNASRITYVYIYKWDTSDLVISDGTVISDRFGYREFTLPIGEYRVAVNSSNPLRTNVHSNKIIITKGTTRVVQYNAYTGVFAYP